MDWPTANHRAIVLGVGVSQTGVDPGNREEIAAHCRRAGFEPHEFEPIIEEIAAVARARNTRIAEVLAERSPQRALDLGEPSSRPRSRTWSSLGVERINRAYAGGPRRRRHT